MDSGIVCLHIGVFQNFTNVHELWLKSLWILVLWLSLHWHLAKFWECPGLWLQSLCLNLVHWLNECGFLMDLLDLRLGPLCCVSLIGAGTVSRLCLKSLCLSFMNFLFLQYIPPALVHTLYVLLLITSITMVLAQFFTLGTSWMWTAPPVFNLGRSFELLLWCHACWCFISCITLLCLCMCFGCCNRSGSKHLNFLEFSNSAGDGRLWFKGVVMYDRIAKCRSSPPSIALVRLFFTVCTNLSTWPLDCALVGDVILWSICQSLMKSLNSCDVNCVPPSEIMHFGIPTVVRSLSKFWLHSTNGDSAVFWQQGTDWNNQLLEDIVFLSMRKCLNQVVPIWCAVFLQTAASPFVDSWQILHRFDTGGRCPWCPL